MNEKSLYCSKGGKVIFSIVSSTMETIGILSVKDDNKITEISSYRTISGVHFLPRGRKVPKRTRPDEEPRRFLPGAIPPPVPRRRF